MRMETVDRQEERQKWTRQRKVTAFAVFAATAGLGVGMLTIGCWVQPGEITPESVVALPTALWSTYTPLPVPSVELTPTSIYIPTPTGGMPVSRGVVTADVWVLDAPSPSGKTFACALLNGYEVEILGREGEYWYVRYEPSEGGIVQGWVARVYVVPHDMLITE